MKQVAIYTTPTCHFCKEAKAYFQQHNVAYSEYDVLADAAKRTEMVEKSGQMGVPVVTIGDDVVVGFDPEQFSKLLELSA